MFGIGPGSVDLSGVNYSYYDGSNDYIVQAANMAGLADGKTGTLAFWIKQNTTQGINEKVFAIGTSVSNFECSMGAAAPEDRPNVRGYNSAGSIILSIRTTATVPTDGTATHVAFSWDLATTTAHCYVNGASSLTSTTVTDDTIDWDDASSDSKGTVGAQSDGTNKIDACIGQLLFDTDYIDLSVAANLARFYSGGPVSFGYYGEKPLGKQPLIFINQPFGIGEENRGSGGAFTEVGALTACAL